MDNRLYDLLRSCHSDSSEITHVTTYGPSAKWNIADNCYEDFWRKYCEMAQNPETSKSKLCLAETPRKHMPIIADLTLKFHPLQNPEDEPYEEDFILAVVYCYQQVIKETLKVSESGPELICCVLKTETKIEDNLLICRIRLHFPYCKTLGQVQNRVIRPIVLQMLRTNNVFSYLPSQPVNDWEDIIDPLSVERPILMYGSSSSPNIPKLYLEYIFPSVNFEDIRESKTSVMETSETFFFQNHEHMTKGIITTKMFEEEENDDYWLPYFLSIYYLKEITLAKSISASTEKTTKYMKKTPSFEEEDKNNPEYLSTVFLGMLNQKRAEKEHYWRDVGRALNHCFHSDERGLEKWIDFTETCDTFTAEDCRKEYLTFNDKKITIKTLAFYAKEDSPEEYKRWHEAWYLPYIERATSCSHADVADAIYHVYWLEFACSNLSKNRIYQFKNHVWKQLDSGITLREYMSGDFLTLIEKFRIDVALQMQESNDKNFKDSAEILIQKICKLINKLKNRSFKNLIFSEAAERFYVEEFEEKLDANPELMGMINGVIQTLDKKAVVRDGKPEDYVSRTTGLFWRHDLHWKHPLVVRLLSWLNKVFPDKALLDYFGKLIASCLQGRNSDKIFPVHTGQGNNSKSMIKKLIEAAFNCYCITIPTAVFTNNKSGGGPDPAIARSKFAHLAFAQEPDSDVPFKTGTIKEMTGGDRFFARFLNENGSEIEPMFTLNLICNRIPKFPQADQAIKNRTRVIPYLSTWVKNPPKNPDDQFRERKFLMDPFFEKQIPELAVPFMWWLIQMYKKYRQEGLNEPPIVSKYTDAYWEENDVYGQFIKENIEKAYKPMPEGWKGERQIDDTSSISLANLYSTFKEWYKSNYEGSKMPDRQIVRDEIENRVTKCRNRAFYGVKFKCDIAADI